MTTFEAIILGVIQGLTEFLPVSSSGHLMLGQALLGFDDMEKYLLFGLICHVGTLLAICWIFFNKIKGLLTSRRSQLLKLMLGTIPLVPLVFMVKWIKPVFSQPQYLGYFFLTTALFLYLGIRFGHTAAIPALQKRQWRDSLLIGCFQAIAVFPGISRSGTTISAARCLGWPPEEALTFSFLLAIPTILGGTAHELLHFWKHPEQITFDISPVHYFAGFFSSLATGIFALLLIQRLAVKQKFMYFVWYCIALGIFTLFYFNYG